MKQIRSRVFVLGLLMSMFLGGCSLMPGESKKLSSSSDYFSSPEEAVPIITELLKKEDFKTLASYYDLSQSEVTREELESGDFFIRKKRPEVSHPAFWRVKHPFSPGFKYSSMRSSSEENVYFIYLEVKIDQGSGSPPQTGRSYFCMIKSDKGWKVLPYKLDDTPDEEIMKKMSETPEPLPDPPWMKKEE